MRVSLKLTSTSLDVLKKGDVIEGAEDLGPIRSVRLTRDGKENARIFGEAGDDVFGLPSIITVIR